MNGCPTTGYQRDSVWTGGWQQWPRTVGIHLKVLVVVACAWTVLVSVGHAQTPDRQVVVLGRGVACRAAPSLSGSVVERLEVAELLNRAASQSGALDWVPVEVAGGRVCFVSRRLVTNFDIDFPERAVIAIVESTARLTGRIPFGRMAVVHALFENRWQGITVDGSAEMELLELQVLERTARSIGHEDLSWGSESDRSRGLRRGDARRADIAAWLDRHERRLTYFEISARWGVVPEWYWALHDAYRDDPLADRIAWTASRQDPPGECEGDLACYVGRGFYGEFEYLRQHPDGAYVPETLQGILDYLIFLNERPQVKRACDGRGGEEMADRIEAVRPILDRIEHSLTFEIATMLEVLARAC